MTIFLWVVLVLCAVDGVGKLACLAAGSLPPRTKLGTALDVIGCVALVVWAAVLLK